jgi:hypothetical protein
MRNYGWMARTALGLKPQGLSRGSGEHLDHKHSFEYHFIYYNRIYLLSDVLTPEE